MQRVLLNGSPRGKASNSRVILAWIAEGLAGAQGSEIPVLDLARTRELDAQCQAVLDADEVVLVFPLYTDSMPALVKAFLEAVAAAGERLQGRRVAFVVQGGFPEAIHSEAVAAYLTRLCARLGLVHGGTLIRGNSEGLRLMPAWQTARTRRQFVRAGRELARDGRFSAEVTRQIAGRRRMGWSGVLAYRFLGRLGVTNLYWNLMLKKHGAFDQRFAAPYGPAHVG